MKAQTSLETISILITIFFLVAVVLLLTISKQQESDSVRNWLEKTNACNAFANEVKSLFVLGNGTRSTVELDYNIKVSSRTAVIDSVVCRLCCNLTKNASLTFTLRPGLTRLENRNGEIFSIGPKLASAARYSKPGHAFVSDETSGVRTQDGNAVTVDKDNRVLHVVFDMPLANDKITAFARCRNADTIELKNEGLGTVISSASCLNNVWMWVNFTANGSVFDLNTNNRDVDYDFIDVIW